MTNFNPNWKEPGDFLYLSPLEEIIINGNYECQSPRHMIEEIDDHEYCRFKDCPEYKPLAHLPEAVLA